MLLAIVTYKLNNRFTLLENYFSSYGYLPQHPETVRKRTEEISLDNTVVGYKNLFRIEPELTSTISSRSGFVVFSEISLFSCLSKDVDFFSRSREKSERRKRTEQCRKLKVRSIILLTNKFGQLQFLTVRLF